MLVFLVGVRSDTAPSMLHLFVTDQTNHIHSICMPAVATASDLKGVVSSKTGIPEEYHLYYKNKLVFLRKSLQEQNIPPESNLNLTFRLKGGAG